MQTKKITKLGVLLALISSFIVANTAMAVLTVPNKLVYEGRLLNAAGTAPMTTAHTFRFSFWAMSGVTFGDITGTGAINTLAPNYGGWDEVQNITPNSDGFFSFELGTATPLPMVDHTKQLYLQVEVKKAGDPDTAYEILDRDISNPLVDRSPIGSVPYALNADLLDYHEIGTSTGDIVILQAGNVFPESVIPGGTNSDIFILDNNDDAAAAIGLQFGNTIAEILSWDILGNYFNFSNDVNVQGNITLTGTVDGVDISTLDTTVNNHLDGGPSKHDASEIDVEAVDGHYYTAGDLESAIDDLDEAIFTLSGATANLQIILPPGFEGASYKADGTSNVGKLTIDSDSINNRNFYNWTSTRGTLQDYDIRIQVPVPANFGSWTGANPWKFMYRSTNAATTENQADIYIYDTAGALVALTGTNTDLANTVWSSTSLGFAGAPAFTPGGTFTIVIRVHARNNEEMHIGEITLDWTTI
ncbi:hypothetical protein JW911_00280 [Candidatus Peregrinibacteria bacterium]|nr:hypothetical protein [Candidatus Peregrinibacteria bacterium]